METSVHPLRLLQVVAMLALGVSVAACSSSSNSPPEPISPPAVTPKIVSSVPTDAATDVPNTTSVSVHFDTAMDAATLTSTSFILACPDGTQIPGTVDYDSNNRTATFVRIPALPSTNLPQDHVIEPLPADVVCTAKIASGVRDASGVALGSDFVWSFATTADQDFLELGKQIFRFDTFGDETQWSDALRMHEVIGAAVDPIVDGSISLTSPDTTVALISLDAVVGVKGTVEEINGKNTLTRVGITCALCHSTVDDSFAPGIGKRLDGWPNRDLNPGAIIALSPALTQAQKDVYNSWGPGLYDPRYNIDGLNGPQVITPAFGLRGIHRITATGDGDMLAYWNRYVGVTQMGGHGNFTDLRIGTTGVNITNGSDDLISAKLPALQEYQLSIAAPPPPAGSFDTAAAARGKILFDGAATCATCHSGPEFTDANLRLHAVSEVVSEPEAPGVPSYASRTATKMYRTAPLRGVWQHPPYFHNGSAATLEDVVSMYNTRKSLGLTAADVEDLAQYLKSL